MKKLFFIALFLWTYSACAATYYVDGSASNDSGNGSSDSPKKYIKSGISLMTGGDTLIIKDGTYKGIDNMLCAEDGWYWTGIPNGSVGAYTTIKAEHDFGVVIDGEGVSPRTPLYLQGRSYVQLEGLVFRYGNGPSSCNFHLDTCDHIKVLRCASYEPNPNNDTSADPYYAMSCFYTQYSTYCLFEDCFAWGRVRYVFMNGGAYGNYGINSNNVYRRCVVRHDASENNPAGYMGDFVNYYAGPNYYQNCVSIDGGDPGNCADSRNYVFFGANGTTGININSCISLSNSKSFNFFTSSSTGTVLKNSVFADLYGGSKWYSPPSLSDIKVENCLFTDFTSGTDPVGTGLNIEDRAEYVKNNIFLNMTTALIKSDSGVDYNVFYGNGANYDSTNAGAHDVTNRNPLTNGLSYLTRIESGSWLKTAGESGGQIGAEIVYKLGVSGTLYGETGWNTLTGDLLWPFPNEDTIRTQMRAYNLHSVDGTRGFCADGETLTHYIMNYLGNGNPYGEASSATTKSATSGNVLLSGGVSLN